MRLYDNQFDKIIIFFSLKNKNFWRAENAFFGGFGGF